MAKKRYSEDFYQEIDVLIKLQHEFSLKRSSSFEIAIAGEEEPGFENGKKEHNGKNGHKIKRLKKAGIHYYKLAPSFWEIARHNKILKYMAAFMVAFIFLISISVFIATKFEKSQNAYQAEAQFKNGTLNPIKVRQQTESKKAKIIPNITGRSLTARWPKAQHSFLEREKTPEEKLNSVPSEKFEPETGVDNIREIGKPFLSEDGSTVSY